MRATVSRPDSLRCIATGLQVLEAMMEADREVLCGPKGRHQVERPAWRGGSVDSHAALAHDERMTQTRA